MQASVDDLLNRNGNDEDARAIVAAEGREIDLYEKNKAYVSYGVYIARKLGWNGEQGASLDSDSAALHLRQ